MKHQPEYQIKVLQNLADIAPYAGRWNQLCASLPHQNPLMSHTWLSTYFEYCTDDFLHWSVICAFQANELVGILPVILINNRRYGLSFQEISLPFNSETMSVDMVIAPQHGQALYDVLYKAAFRQYPKARYLHLRRIDGLSASLQKKSEKLHVQEFIENGAGMANNSDFASRKAALPKNFKSNLNKARNKLEREGPCTFVMDNTADPLQQMQIVIDTERLSWKGQAGSAIACSEKNVRFYHALAQRLAEQGWLRVHYLQVNHHIIAANMGILFAGNLLLWKLGYDEQHRKLSPGGILIEELLRNVDGDKNISRFDLMTNEDWYNNWNMQWRPFYDLYIYTWHPASLYLAAMQKLKIRIKKLLKR